MSTDDLLNLHGIGQRAESFRFDVLDPTLARIGTIQPSSRTVPLIENNMNRSIKRDLRSLTLPPGTARDLNPIADRLRPVYVLETGYTRPLGVFVFLDATGLRYSYGSTLGTRLGDQCVVLDDPIAEVFGLAIGDPISAALAYLFEDAGINTDNYEIDFIAAVIAAPIAWPPGTSRLAIMNQLAAMAGCYSVFFDYRGIGRVMVRQDLDTTTPVVRYVGGASGNIVRGSIVETDQTLTAPNRYLVIDNAANDSPIVGVHLIPPESPNSFENIGRYKTRVINEQGLPDTTAAVERARAAAQQDAADYAWVSFSGMVDPRHDTFNIVQFLGQRFREQKWGGPLAAGARWSHDLRRVYEAV